ncbi:protein phosphatase CheZ [Falsiroseomonas selenitidurans]|uniref:Protein phosphatase CheZ n=1 Tax=Falsiroseomonas selenitidurans TaxID=2716335 RepID=A0ABX1E4U3_9PROT|nr:protein phosphatase CheZ [Falsiroseomonas selenitidurans]NKC29950.1 protein phosphatase CheZ [Falsiroseomonas selenitidurans]
MPDGHAANPPDGSPEGERIETAVRAVLGSMSGDLTVVEASLLAELEGLGRTVARAKQEIASLRVDDITLSHIPSATDELDAIVDHTAQATNEILDVCETLEGVAGRVGGVEAEALASAVTRIYEACSFQDITGQRIGKVVQALKAIEARVEQVTLRFGVPGGAPPPPEPQPEPVEGETEGRRLAHGPQLPGAGVSQADIDKLLADFD